MWCAWASCGASGWRAREDCDLRGLPLPVRLHFAIPCPSCASFCGSGFQMQQVLRSAKLMSAASNAACVD